MHGCLTILDCRDQPPEPSSADELAEQLVQQFEDQWGPAMEALQTASETFDDLERMLMLVVFIMAEPCCCKAAAVCVSVEALCCVCTCSPDVCTCSPDVRVCSPDVNLSNILHRAGRWSRGV